MGFIAALSCICLPVLAIVGRFIEGSEGEATGEARGGEGMLLVLGILFTMVMGMIRLCFLFIA